MISNKSECDSKVNEQHDGDNHSQSDYDIEELQNELEGIIGNTSANLRLYQLQKELQNEAAHMNVKSMSRVLIICTGGTLTMVHTPKGYMS